MTAVKLRAVRAFWFAPFGNSNMRGITMRYIRPHITGVFQAISAIQSEKGPGAQEIHSVLFTNGPAYQADE
jgi:hypothetical protein